MDLVDLDTAPGVHNMVRVSGIKSRLKQEALDYQYWKGAFWTLEK
jgi:hypothetical protein